MAKPKIPTLEDVQADFQRLFDIETFESDAICAIVSTAFVDHALSALFSQYLLEGDTKNSLLRETGPLGPLLNKARFAYCLGMISKPCLTNIQYICEIRNLFAHKIKAIDFDTPEIVALCEKLIHPQVLLSEDDHPVRKKPKLKFKFICTYLCLTIVAKVHGTTECEEAVDPFG